MDGTYPGATKTFNVLRRVAVLGANGNRTMQLSTIATGISVVLSASAEVIDEDKSGPQFSGEYKATTFLDAPIFIGDLLQDSVETEADGSLVKYQVQGKVLGAFSMDLRLQRTNPGV